MQIDSLPALTTDDVVQILGSGILFLNKIALYKNKEKLGWILGIIGLMILVPSIYSRNLITITVYHFFLSAFMAYGYYTLSAHSATVSEQTKVRTKRIILLAAFLCCVFLTQQTKHDPHFTGWQLTQTITGLLGCLFIIPKAPRAKIVGWNFNIVSHVVCTYIMVHNNAYWIAAFQVLSIGFAFASISDNTKKLKQDLPI